MKVEFVLCRSNFRDYYDFYSQLIKGHPLKRMVQVAAKYSNHTLKTRDALSFLSNGSNYKKGKDFNLMNLVYEITNKEIEDLIKPTIKKEYPLIIP